VVLVGLVDPPAGEVDQLLEVDRGAEGLGLEAARLTGGSGRGILGPAVRHGRQGWIEVEARGVIEALIKNDQ
jgi:hypothetical protein